MDIHRIDGQTVQVLRRRGLSDAEIGALTPEQALTEYCAYFGQEPWAARIVRVLDNLRAADQVAP